MTDDTPDADDSSRSLPTEAATAGTAALGATAPAAAQDDGDGVVEQDSGGQKGLMMVADFRPNATIAFVSDVIEWIPNVEEVQDNVWSDYNTRIVRYLNSGYQVPMFVAHAADLPPYDEDLGFVADGNEDPPRPEVFDLDRNYTLFGDSPKLVTVNFVDVREPSETDVLDDEDWWRSGEE